MSLETLYQLEHSINNRIAEDSLARVLEIALSISDFKELATGLGLRLRYQSIGKHATCP
jgi:hypothetical protein